jgi:hypothetical protein
VKNVPVLKQRSSAKPEALLPRSRIIAVWCEYLTSAASLHVINDSPRGWKFEAAQKRVGMEEWYLFTHHGAEVRHATATAEKVVGPGPANKTAAWQA